MKILEHAYLYGILHVISNVLNLFNSEAHNIIQITIIITIIQYVHIAAPYELIVYNILCCA